jgi:uncharacterized protein (TIGR04255 family)
MKLQEHKREKYKNNTLIEVICQVRFPVLLSIFTNESLLAEFQSRIIRDYPIYEKSLSQEGMPLEMANMMASMGLQLPDSSDKFSHQFMTSDRIWLCKLGRSDFTLKNNGQYKDFEELKGRFETLFAVFNELYKPPFYTRKALRYRNIIAPKFLNKSSFNKTSEWQQYIPASIAPELHDPVMQHNVRNFEKRIFLGENDEKAHVVHSLAEIEGIFRGQSFEPTMAYIVDIDCFAEGENYEYASIVPSIVQLNGNVKNIYQSSITPTVREHMEILE